MADRPIGRKNGLKGQKGPFSRVLIPLLKTKPGRGFLLAGATRREIRGAPSEQGEDTQTEKSSPATYREGDLDDG